MVCVTHLDKFAIDVNVMGSKVYVTKSNYRKKYQMILLRDTGGIPILICRYPTASQRVIKNL